MKINEKNMTMTTGGYYVSDGSIISMYTEVEKVDGKLPDNFIKSDSSADECRRRFPKATILNYKTGSLGLNLQHLPYTIYFDKTFDYGDMIQASHRNYRVGQEHDVRYLSLTGDVGLENIMNSNIKKKISMADYFKKISKEQLMAEL